MDINYYYLAIYIPVIGVIFSILSIIKNYLYSMVELKRLKSFQTYETLMEYYFDKAYTTVYKDQILVFSSEGMSPKEEDIKQIQHDYLELLIKMFGEWLMIQFENYYGDRSTLFFNALTYFDNHYENDAIKEDAINKQLEQ